MKLHRPTAVLLGLVAVGIAFGCNGQVPGQNKKSGSTTAPVTSNPAPVTSNPPAPVATPVAPASRFLYTANLTDTVQQLTVDPKTGVPSLTGTAVPSAAGTWAIAASSDGKFVYALGSTDIGSFGVDPKTGTLTRIAGQTITLGTNPWNIAVDPTNSFVFVTDASDDTVTSLKIGATGALTNIITASAPAGSGLHDIAVDPSGKFCYATGTTLGNVTCFTIEAGTGKVAKASVAMGGAGARPIAVDPKGKFVFVGNTTDKTVSVFSRDPQTGALTAVGTASKVTNTPYSLAIDSASANLYVGCDESSTATPPVAAAINQFKVDAAGGLKANTPATTAGGSFPAGMSIDASGQFAFTADFAGTTTDSVSAFKLDATTGAATANGKALSLGAGASPHGICQVK